MRPLRAGVTRGCAVVRWWTVPRVIVAGVFFSQAVSRLLRGRLVTTAPRSMFTRSRFRTTTPAPAVLGGVRVGSSNGVT